MFVMQPLSPSSQEWGIKNGGGITIEKGALLCTITPAFGSDTTTRKIVLLHVLSSEGTTFSTSRELKLEDWCLHFGAPAGH